MSLKRWGKKSFQNHQLLLDCLPQGGEGNLAVNGCIVFQSFYEVFFHLLQLKITPPWPQAGRIRIFQIQQNVLEKYFSQLLRSKRLKSLNQIQRININAIYENISNQMEGSGKRAVHPHLFSRYKVAHLRIPNAERPQMAGFMHHPPSLHNPRM